VDPRWTGRWNKKSLDNLVFTFGDFTIDPKDHCLSKGGKQIHLRPKTFSTLLFLVANPQRLIRKDELFESIWPEVIVSQNTLSHCIEEIRQALGDDPREPRYVETVPRLGYKFLAKVSECIRPGQKENAGRALMKMGLKRYS